MSYDQTSDHFRATLERTVRAAVHNAVLAEFGLFGPNTAESVRENLDKHLALGELCDGLVEVLAPRSVVGNPKTDDFALLNGKLVRVINRYWLGQPNPSRDGDVVYYETIGFNAARDHISLADWSAQTLIDPRKG